jgi:hypothetical protein
LIGGEVTRAGLRLALLLTLLSVVTLLFQDRSSAGFVVSLMALAVSVLFVIAVLVVARLGVARLPERSDKRADKGYNTAVRNQGRDT